MLADALKKICEARALPAPFPHPLTPQQRQDRPRMGDKTRAFVTKTAGYARALSVLRPSFIFPPVSSSLQIP